MLQHHGTCEAHALCGWEGRELQMSVKMFSPAVNPHSCPVNMLFPLSPGPPGNN